MPTSLHPQAKFDPIPPDLDLHSIVDRTPNLKWVQRVSRSQIRNLGQQEFEKLVLIHVIMGGKPLVITGWDSVLPKDLFTAKWLEDNYDKKQENVRDIGNGTDMPMTTGHYLRAMRQLTDQWSPTNYRDDRRQRLYLKDIDCPPEWRDALQKTIHPSLWYLNEHVSGHDNRTEQQDEDIFRTEASTAPAGDLMSSLPEEMRAQNLMCYIGHEGTYTPAHREMCASLGQNIMVEASQDTDKEKAGSSIWFMTESKDREVVREYFLSMLGHDIEIEKHFAQINAWKKAPFDVYIVEQKVGDFILIPPLAAHQVWNRGTRTMKVAWNRTTPETLDMAIHEALPKARLVCRDEQYKNKAMIYFTLSKYYRELQQLEENAEITQMSFMGFGQDIVKNSPRAKQLAGDFKKLLGLFTEIMIDEIFAYKETDVEFLEFDSCVTCSYCRSNIFNRFLTCKHCVRTLVTGEDDAYDICMECYAMGRSCVCISKLQWCEQWSWSDLVDNYEAWRAMIIKNDGFVDFEHSPHPLEVARQRSGKKSVAQLCQEALRRRPWTDITKQDKKKKLSDSELDAEEEMPRKKKYKRKQKKGELRRCHVCCHKDYNYRVHECTNPGCMEAYCYGVLYRGFDMMPQKVLEDEQWQCPKCLGICNCGACRRKGTTNPYTPKNTRLGHDTRPIADDRSVEALVDFRVHNLSWLKNAGEESRSNDSGRMQRLRQQAHQAKAQDVTEQEEAGQAINTNGDYDPAIHGYWDQSRVLDDQGQPAPNYDEGLDQLRAAVIYRDENASGAVESSAEESHVTSLYPDPTIPFGMGYYEKDDTPDKILFDPYQAPSADAIRIDGKIEVPEFVKKSIRAAKRKAKRENDDPDFIVGKNHHKKARITRDPEPDFLDSMDPALFNRGPSVPEAVMDHPTADETGQPEEQRAESEPEDGQGRGAQKGRPAPRYEANAPSLRHARPQKSYAELEDGGFEDFEDEVLVFPMQDAQGGSFIQEDLNDNYAMDLAAHAVRKMFNKPLINKNLLSKALNYHGTIVRKRGCPPKRLSTIAQDSEAGPSLQSGESSEKEPPKRSGRPTRTSLAAAAAADGHGSNDIDGKEWQCINQEAETVSENVTSEQSANTAEGAPRTKHGPGRPKRSGVTTIAASANLDEEEDGFFKDIPDPPVSSEPEIPRRRRGRPRKSDAVPKPTPQKDEAPSPVPQFMSMAERMAMKGKKFKIGKRKSQGEGAARISKISSAVAIPSRAAKRQESAVLEQSEQSIQPSDYEDFVTPAEESNDDVSDASSICTPRPAIRPLVAPSGRTVVRLSDTDEDASVATSPSNSEDVSSSDDGEDIPAIGRPVSSEARGRGRGGRGRGFGRGRGRRRL